MVPSTCPSIVRSSLPFNSPLITTDLPMFTMSFSMLWPASAPRPGAPRAAGAGRCAAAGAPLAPPVAEAVIHATQTLFGNASSVHHFGQEAKAAVDEARSALAALIGGE